MKKVFTFLMTAAALLLISAGVMAQDGETPYLNSTHTYTVTMEDGDNNTANWVIADGSGTPLVSQPTITTNVVGNLASMEITWADSWASVTSDYKILFTEEDGTTSCVSQRELDVDVIANTFYLTMDEDASDCHDLSGEILGKDEIGNSTLLFSVNLNKDATWEIDNWQFDFTVIATGNYSIQIVKLDGGSDLGNSGSYSNQSVAGTNATAQIEVVVNGPVEEGTDVTVTLSNGNAVKGTINTPDNGTGDKNQVLTVDPLPATSIISYD